MSSLNRLSNIEKHPCFNEKSSCNTARLHLPVAPQCNIGCNYCNRKYDCTNESRPGVTSKILTPDEAINKYKRLKKRYNNIKVIGIAGPGDPLCDFNKTYKTLYGIRKIDPDVLFCVSTNGLVLTQHVDDLVNIGVSHITVTINTINPSIGENIYKFINYNNKQYSGKEGAGILIKNQLIGMSYAIKQGMIVKVNIVMIKDINEKAIVNVVKKARDYGAHMTNITKMIPVKGSAFEMIEPVTKETLNKTRKMCSHYIKQMYHCKQCRADAFGTLAQEPIKECVSCI